MSTRFLVVVPFHNAWPWITTCLGSVQAQRYPHVDVIVADDASTDQSGEHARQSCIGYGWLYHRNVNNRRMPYNLRLAIAVANPEPETVIVIVDGDDWLPHDQVLDRLATYYEDPHLWLTWGSYTRHPDPTVMPNPATAWPPDVVKARSYRSTYHCTAFNHPLTFRKHLWDHVTDDDLKDNNGNWFTAGYDAAIMFPMTEMAGPEHFRFIPEVLYVYNESNPLSDGKVRPMECDHAHNHIRQRPPKAQVSRGTPWSEPGSTPLRDVHRALEGR